MCIVLSAIVIRVKEFLEPLQELKVILETTFNQLIHRNYLLIVIDIWFCHFLSGRKNSFIDVN